MRKDYDNEQFKYYSEQNKNSGKLEKILPRKI